jgi:hypothetical protein
MSESRRITPATWAGAIVVAFVGAVMATLATEFIGFLARHLVIHIRWRG